MTIHSSYAAAVLAMRDLGDALRQAVAVHNEPPPGGPSRIPGEASRQGVTDPTADLVLDPRNVEIARVLHETDVFLVKTRNALTVLVEDATAAVGAWEGRK